MIILRNKNICFLNGFMAQEKYRDNNIFHQAFSEYFPQIQYPVLRSDPKYGIQDLKELQKTKWNLVIGFSMGGGYASRIKANKTLLINPALYISPGMKMIEPKFVKGFEKLENIYPIIAHNVIGMFALDDKYRSGLLPQFLDIYRDSKIINFPGPHIPNKEIIEKYIVPEIKKLI